MSGSCSFSAPQRPLVSKEVSINVRTWSCSATKQPDCFIVFLFHNSLKLKQKQKVRLKMWLSGRGLLAISSPFLSVMFFQLMVDFWLLLLNPKLNPLDLLFQEINGITAALAEELFHKGQRNHFTPFLDKEAEQLENSGSAGEMLVTSSCCVSVLQGSSCCRQERCFPCVRSSFTPSPSSSAWPRPPASAETPERTWDTSWTSPAGCATSRYCRLTACSCCRVHGCSCRFCSDFREQRSSRNQ